MLNKILSLEENTLEIIIEDARCIMYLLVNDSDYKTLSKFKPNLIFQISKENSLSIYLKNQSLFYGVEINKQHVNSDETKALISAIEKYGDITINILNSDIPQNKTSFEEKISENMVNTILSWSNPSNKSFYKYSPEDSLGLLLLHNSNDTLWISALLTKDNYNIAKENPQELRFVADIFEGELALYISTHNSLLAATQIPDSFIDDNLREHYKEILNQDIIKILLNFPNSTDSTVLEIETPLNKETLERMKYYIGL